MVINAKKSQVVVAVLDHDRQSFLFLLLLTNEKRGKFWQNVTGSVDENETFEEAAIREASEETGLVLEAIVDLIDLKLSHEFTDSKKKRVHEKSFLIILDGTWKVKLDPHEHIDSRWVSMDELSSDMVKFKGNYEALEKSKQLLKHWGL